MSTNNNGDVPGDLLLLVPWFNAVRALRSVSKVNSHAVVSITVIVDENGLPVFWSSPKVTRLEPRSNGAAVEALLSELTSQAKT